MALGAAIIAFAGYGSAAFIGSFYFRNHAAEAAVAAQGVGLRITSGWRSKGFQQRLFDDAVGKYGNVDIARQFVASPDVSKHVVGQAVDVAPVDAALTGEGERWARIADWRVAASSLSVCVYALACTARAAAAWNRCDVMAKRAAPAASSFASRSVGHHFNSPTQLTSCAEPASPTSP